MVKGIISDDLQITRVTLIFKNGNNNELGNRPISVLPYFPKFLERIMYKIFENDSVKSKILYSNQFGFHFISI